MDEELEKLYMESKGKEFRLHNYTRLAEIVNKYSKDINTPLISALREVWQKTEGHKDCYIGKRARFRAVMAWIAPFI